METSKKTVAVDKLYLTGLVLILISTIIFIVPDFNLVQLNNDSYFGVFFANYAISTLYFAILIFNSIIKFKWQIFKNNIEYINLLLILYLISAFSLNRELTVFEQSTDWVCIFIVMQCITLILLHFRNRLPIAFKYILIFSLGAGVIFYSYYTLYLFPLYMLGIMASPFFGISLHAFTPLIIVIFYCLYFVKILSENKKMLIPFLIGVSFPVLFAILFLIQWQQAKEKINFITNESIINETSLPLWSKVSQQLELNNFTEKILKTDLVYTTADANNSWFWRMPRKSFDEVRKHDPLVMMSTLLSGKTDISDSDKIKILESSYDSRHKAQERLWSGDKLEISNVISNIKVFPEYHIAYTEKIISIQNNQTSRWRNQQEAIFTFHLPEGGVVTSLSLWINGKEEKGITTTKSKADSAYKTIVGVEMRDPSVIHWQEGNTVSVRVFPCTPIENRRFKIGVTAPLRTDNEKLVYENIYFEGPHCRKTTESVKIEFTSPPEELESTFNLTESGGNIYKTNKQYEPYWEIKLNSPELSTKGFSFDGCSYFVEKYNKEYESFKPKTFYLDLNNSWTKEELFTLWDRIKENDVYVYNEQLIKVEDENITEIFEQFEQFNFSLFPLNEITNPEEALLISKSTSTSPNLSDLSTSEFSNKLIQYLKNRPQIRLFNMGFELSPYLKTLKELRVFTYDQGKISELSKLLTEGKFVRSIEDDSNIVISNSSLLIKESNHSDNNGAPDHLLRLFAYNRIMKRVSENYFSAGAVTDESVEEAQKAYVVSPVSSLIVLETQKDYDRFDIKESQNSLKNATTKSSGAVPEPHEWLLIILTACVVLFFVYKSYFNI